MYRRQSGKPVNSDFFSPVFNCIICIAMMQNNNDEPRLVRAQLYKENILKGF